MRARAHLSILFLATLAAGCGSSLQAETGDAAPSADVADKRDVEPAAFCTGDAPRMVVNGVGLVPTVATYPIVMDCCDGGGGVLTKTRSLFPSVSVGWWNPVRATPCRPPSIWPTRPRDGRFWSAPVAA